MGGGVSSGEFPRVAPVCLRVVMVGATCQLRGLGDVGTEFLSFVWKYGGRTVPLLPWATELGPQGFSWGGLRVSLWILSGTPRVWVDVVWGLRPS